MGVPIWGTTMNQWSGYSTPLYVAVSLWSWAREGNEAAIRDWTEPDPAKPCDADRWPMYFVTQKWVQRWPPGTTAILEGPDPLQRARQFAAAIVHEGLRMEAISPTFRPSEHPRLEYLPSTLGGALWIQAAEWMAGERRVECCQECGSWFVKGRREDGSRADAILCSDACKARAYRQRRARAAELVKDGMTVARAAREVGSETATVRGWVREARAAQKARRGPRRARSR